MWSADASLILRCSAANDIRRVVPLFAVYVHVCDLATAHVAALQYLLDGVNDIALNLSTSEGYSVRDVLNTIGSHRM